MITDLLITYCILSYIMGIGVVAQLADIYNNVFTVIIMWLFSPIIILVKLGAVLMELK